MTEEARGDAATPAAPWVNNSPEPVDPAPSDAPVQASNAARHAAPELIEPDDAPASEHDTQTPYQHVVTGMPRSDQHNDSAIEDTDSPLTPRSEPWSGSGAKASFELISVGGPDTDAEMAAAAAPTRTLRQRLTIPAEQELGADWAWVEEWRRGHERTPWSHGLALAVFAALIIGCAVYVISAGLSDRPVVAFLANVVVAAGLTPALWMSRQLPVLRWISLGGAIGTAIAWIAVLFFPMYY